MRVIMNILEKISSGDYHTVKCTGSSDVWNYFKRIVNTHTQEVIPFAICVRCEKIFKFQKGSSPSNLKKHLCYKHQDDVKCLTIKRLAKRKMTYTAKSVSDRIREEVLQNCVKCVIRDLRPTDTVNGEGFTELAQSLVEIGIKLGTQNISITDILPNSTALSHQLHILHAIEQQRFVTSLREIIENARCAGTMEMWTDVKRQRSFLTFNVHYIDATWQLYSRNLFTIGLESSVQIEGEDNKSPENIICLIDDKFEELNLGRGLHQKMTFTTDQGSVTRNALHNHSKVNCATHTLYIILEHVFHRANLEGRAPRILDLIAKCQSLVESLKRTGRIRMLEASAKLSPIWNTKFDLLYTVRQNVHAIGEILEGGGESHRLAGIEMSFLDRVLAFLEPFKSATFLLESTKNPTIHCVLLHMHIVKEKLLKLRNVERIPEIQSIVSYCLDVFNTEYHPDRMYKIAAFLWPEHKQLRYLSGPEREEVYGLVKEELINISMNISGTSPSTSPSPKVEMQTFVDDDEFNVDDMVAKYKDIYSDKDHTSASQINIQMALYKDACYPENNILQWWSVHGKEFPLLENLARRVLCIPASNAASERAFSSANRILEERRATLKCENLDAILFLHSQQTQCKCG